MLLQKQSLIVLQSKRPPDEATIAAPIVGGGREAAGGAEEPWIVIPGPPNHTGNIPTFTPHGTVRRRSVVVVMIAVLDPLDALWHART
jgi:hypothetical protein